MATTPEQRKRLMAESITFKREYDKAMEAGTSEDWDPVTGKQYYKKKKKKNSSNYSGFFNDMDAAAQGRLGSE